MYVRMYVGMYVCMYVCMYVFMYVCIYVSLNLGAWSIGKIIPQSFCFRQNYRAVYVVLFTEWLKLCC